MPLVRISVPAHLSTQKVRVLADAVHAALVQACNVPVNDRFQLISRFADNDRIIDPNFPNVDRTDAPIVEITLLEGHEDTRKRLLFREIALGAAAGGFST